jgi:Flp pilus assembly protein TadG
MKFRRYSRRDFRARARNDERGVVIMLVAVFMLFVVGAMAALSIDVVTIYTAKSEAQLVADGAALAGARVLANSGVTSDQTSTSDGSMGSAETIAQSIAVQVAQSSPVGGRTLIAANGEITVSFVTAVPGDPLVTVRVNRTDLPTFFARIWGNRQVSISATATAEAYNPSNVGGTSATTSPPVAPICIKPWLVPNMDPSSASATAQIFDPASGAPKNPGLLGWSASPLTPACTGVNGSCTPLPALTHWAYLAGDDATTFPHPTRSQPSCNPALTTNYQESVAGCIQVPISCSSPAIQPANIDITAYPATGRNSDTTDAVNCLTHSATGGGDQLTAPLPFEFIAGADNPVTGTSGSDVMVSDSIVTVPVFDTASYAPPLPTVQIIGFVQLFLNPNGSPTPVLGNVNATIINLVGCGIASPGTPINGNGASPVAVRLVTQ